MDSDESKALRKNAEIMRPGPMFDTRHPALVPNRDSFLPGREPFDMFATADLLDSIANDKYVHQPFLDVSWS